MLRPAWVKGSSAAWWNIAYVERMLQRCSDDRRSSKAVARRDEKGPLITFPADYSLLALETLQIRSVSFMDLSLFFMSTTRVNRRLM